MKYGLPVPDNYEFRNDISNLGDHIQAYSILQIYRDMGISDSHIELLNKNEMLRNSNEVILDTLLPINSFMPPNSLPLKIPFYKRYSSITVGISFAGNENLDEDTLVWLETQQPVLCRDEETANLLTNYNIEAYVFGCLTATLPTRAETNNADKIFLVDCPDKFLHFIPDSIKNSSDIVYGSHLVKPDLSPSEYLAMAELYLNNYKTNAKLIITSRLHCAAPCVAMGIPTILVTDNRSGRLAWLDKLIPVYTPNLWDCIDWNPTPVNFENIKELMKIAAIRKITHVQEKGTIKQINEFWRDRPQYKYNNFIEDIFYRDCPYLGSEFEYIIWGLGTAGGLAFKFLSERFPNAKLVCAIDKFAKGHFFGIEISPPEKLLDYPEAFVFGATHTGRAEINKFMKEHNKLYGKDYINFETTSG